MVCQQLLQFLPHLLGIVLAVGQNLSLPDLCLTAVHQQGKVTAIGSGLGKSAFHLTRTLRQILAENRYADPGDTRFFLLRIFTVNHQTDHLDLIRQIHPRQRQAAESVLQYLSGRLCPAADKPGAEEICYAPQRHVGHAAGVKIFILICLKVLLQGLSRIAFPIIVRRKLSSDGVERGQIRLPLQIVPALPGTGLLAGQPGYNSVPLGSGLGQHHPLIYLRVLIPDGPCQRIALVQLRFLISQQIQLWILTVLGGQNLFFDFFRRHTEFLKSVQNGQDPGHNVLVGYAKKFFHFPCHIPYFLPEIYSDKRIQQFRRIQGAAYFQHIAEFPGKHVVDRGAVCHQLEHRSIDSPVSHPLQQAVIKFPLPDTLLNVLNFLFPCRFRLQDPAERLCQRLFVLFQQCLILCGSPNPRLRFKLLFRLSVLSRRKPDHSMPLPVITQIEIQRHQQDAAVKLLIVKLFPGPQYDFRIPVRKLRQTLQPPGGE